jgi:hypothetical protein
MKKFKIVLVLTVFATVFIACDTEEEVAALLAFDITNDVSGKMDLAVMASANGDCVDFTETSTFDLKSNSEISDNYSKITALDINSITWEISDFVGGDGVLMDGGLLKIGETSFEIGRDFDLEAADTANEEFVITDVAKLTAIAAEMLPSGEIALGLESTSKGNCVDNFNFSVKFKQNVTVTVQPL